MLSSIEIPPKKPTLKKGTRSTALMLLLIVIVILAIYVTLTFGETTAPGCVAA